jgi:hypothetical protein
VSQDLWDEVRQRLGDHLGAARAKRTRQSSDEPRGRSERLNRPTAAAVSRGNVLLFCGGGNHVNLRGLPGGAEGVLHWGRRFMKNINRSWTCDAFRGTQAGYAGGVGGRVPMARSKHADTRYLELKNGKYRVTVAVPRALQGKLGTKLKRPLNTDSRATANTVKWAVVAELKAIIDRAGRDVPQGDHLTREALELCHSSSHHQGRSRACPA